MTAAIFDLDGTLLDTLEDLLDATNYALGQFGFPPRTLPQLRAVVGNGAANQIRKSLPPETPEQTVQKIVQVYVPYYAAHCREKTGPYPGVLEALEEIQKHFSVAIVSNKPDRAVKELCSVLFPGILAMGEIPDCPRKPAPDMVLRAMNALGADKGVYIGDSEVDIRTAENAHMPCLSVTWGFRDEEDLSAAGAHLLCRDARQMPACLETLCKD